MLSDCQQAFRAAWEIRPDIVVTELALRGADGWQFIQQLKRQARTRDIPVVMLTGDVDPSSGNALNVKVVPASS